jgi:hypothetical protein
MTDYMPTGGADQAIGDLGRLQGTDPKIRIRQEIVAEHHRLWNSEEIGAATHSDITLQAGVNVATAHDAAKDAELAKLQAVIDEVRSAVLVGGQTEAVRAQGVRQALDAAGLLTTRATEGTTDPEVPGE